MRFKIIYVVLLFLSMHISAQIDGERKSRSIPAIETPEAKDNSKNLKIPAKPEKENKTSGITTPKIVPDLKFPKKELSMFQEEEFGNPGELYIKNINKHLSNLRPTPEEIERRNGSLTDVFLGDFKSKAAFVNVVYRDHGAVDGDVIQVRINDDIIHPRVFLRGGYSGFKLDLRKGFNKIDFVALNQGQSGPNTAEFKVIDDKGNLVTHNQWNLSTGVKATVIVFKD